MSAAQKYIPHYTIEDYVRWEGDWELWGGIPVSTAPGPFGRHQELLLNLVIKLREALLAAECDAKIVTELDWIVSRDTVVRPDAVIVCGGIPEHYVETPPGLTLEVLSESTRERDQTYKRDLYEAERVPVYVMADPIAKTIEVMVLADDGKYEAMLVTDPLQLKLCDDCEITLDTSALF